MEEQPDALTRWEPDDAPEAVLRAEREVRNLALKLGGTGFAATAGYWAVAIQLGFPVLPMSWWVLFVLGLLLYFFFPQTRQARRAREILRRWDEAQVRGLLESSGSTSDARLRTAHNMSTRITQHPGTSRTAADVAHRLVEHLAQTTRDQRVVEVAMEAHGPPELDDSTVRSLSDVLDHLESRAARILGALAELHAAVVGRDAEEVSRLLGEAGDVLADIEAASEVERLLEEP